MIFYICLKKKKRKLYQARCFMEWEKKIKVREHLKTFIIIIIINNINLKQNVFYSLKQMCKLSNKRLVHITEVKLIEAFYIKSKFIYRVN